MGWPALLAVLAAGAASASPCMAHFAQGATPAILDALPAPAGAAGAAGAAQARVDGLHPEPLSAQPQRAVRGVPQQPAPLRGHLRQLSDLD